jgi:hypothetical protein
VNRTWIPRLILMAALALVVSACGADASGLDLTAEADGMATRAPLLTDETLAYQVVEPPEAGIGFEVPASWQQAKPEWAWSPGSGEGVRVGLTWIDLQPPMEAEAALLPRPSQILAAEPVELAWASGRRFTVAVYGPAPAGGDARAPVRSVETHVLLVVAGHGNRRAYDFYAAGPTAEELDMVQPVLDRMLSSAAPLDGRSGKALAP